MSCDERDVRRSDYSSDEAYAAAADPQRFPDQLAEGLRPWQARKFYFSAGFFKTLFSDWIPFEHDTYTGRNCKYITAH